MQLEARKVRAVQPRKPKWRLFRPSRWTPLWVVALSGFIAAPVCPEQPTMVEYVVTMDAPRLIEAFTTGYLYPYDAFASVCHQEDCTPIKTLPPDLISDTLFGVVRHQGRSLVVAIEFGKEVLYARLDEECDGDLSNDVPAPMKPSHWGGYRATFWYSGVPFAIETSRDPQYYEDGSAQMRVLTWTERRGTLRVNDDVLELAVVTRAGQYDSSTSALFLDLDGDGVLKTSSLRSSERYRIDKTAVVVALGRSWTFEVATDGGTVRFRSTALEPAVGWDLSKGSVAPNFWFDLEDTSVSLHDVRGNIVLLHSWGTWCRPCEEEMPALLFAHKQLEHRGVQFVGINRKDRIDAAKEYASILGLEWPQLYGHEADEVAATYRFDFTPAYVLIDKTGRIVSRELRGDALIVALNELALQE